MNNKKNIKKNYIYNVIYQLFSIIGPLITAPYLSRILHSDGIGVNSLITSYASYFILFANLGFSIYAQREIAKYRDNKYECSKIFFEIQICKFITSIVPVTINILLCFFGVYNDYSFLMTIMTINIAAVFFDIGYFYRGYEEFGTIVLKDVSIKIIGIVLTFVFVKTKSDLPIYVLCHSLTTFLSAACLWIGIPKKICKVTKKDIHPFKHFWPSFRLFIPTIAISIYTMLDKTLIGLLVPGTIEQVSSNGAIETIKISEIENGYYAQAESIVKMIMTLLTSLGIVILPRNAYYFSNNMKDKAMDNIYKSFSFTFAFGSALMFGIAAVSTSFVEWFFGQGYGKVGYLMMAFSPVIISIGLNSILGQQYLIANKMDSKYAVIVVLGALINILLNCLLIPRLYSFGALIATVISETLIFVAEYIVVRKTISFKKAILSNIKYLLYGAIMFAVVFMLSSFTKNNNPLTTFALVIVGIIVYVSILVITNDKNLQLVFNKIGGKKHER